MRIRPLALLLPLAPLAAAWSCDDVSADGVKYDLSKLGSRRQASRETDSPPTKNEARVQLDICGLLGKAGGVPDEDQCPENTRVCLTLHNHKESAGDKDRVTGVIPLWTDQTLDSDIRTYKQGRDGDGGVQIKVKAPDYAGTPQALTLTLKCDPSATDPNPTFDSYTDGELKLSWSTPDACPASSGGSSSSGGGFFSGLWYLIKFVFWLGLFGLLAYFVIGVIYNHQTYSARGWDLVPHRDFWRELPGLTQDLGGHVFGGRGGGRGGYSSLG
ncbi:type II membrane protein [Vanrija albida]|uniref:Autophagy-related protein 27 n=1 Tax=Vanrija albida TaxID=181172 RepID=A0ABR3Q8C4_9TREE